MGLQVTEAEATGWNESGRYPLAGVEETDDHAVILHEKGVDILCGTKQEAYEAFKAGGFQLKKSQVYLDDVSLPDPITNDQHSTKLWRFDIEL